MKAGTPPTVEHRPEACFRSFLRLEKGSQGEKTQADSNVYFRAHAPEQA
jgi:hypothetical protein